MGKLEVLMTNLPQHWTRETLENKCQAYGEIASLGYRPEKRFAVIIFSSESEAKDCALAFNARDEDSTIIRAKWRLRRNYEDPRRRLRY